MLLVLPRDPVLALSPSPELQIPVSAEVTHGTTLCPRSPLPLSAQPSSEPCRQRDQQLPSPGTGNTKRSDSAGSQPRASSTSLMPEPGLHRGPDLPAWQGSANFLAQPISHPPELLQGFC